MCFRRPMIYGDLLIATESGDRLPNVSAFGGHLSRRNEPGEPFGRLGSCILFLWQSLLYHVCLIFLVTLFFFTFFLF